MTVQPAKSALEHRLRMVFSAAKLAKAAHARADKADQESYDRMRRAQADGASLSQIAKAAGCSKEWVRRCVNAAPGERP